MKKPFYLTTTLPYVNAPLHIGHALEFVRADTIARWNMLLGHDVFFNTGTDEHGLKIFQRAQEQGVDVQHFVNDGFVTFQKQVESFGVTKHIHYVRTTDAHHIAAAQEFWKRVQDRGYIYKKNYQTKYCVSCELERTDSELVNGECPEHPGQPLEVINEENYFFKASALEKNIEKLFEDRPDFVIPAFRFNEMKAFVSRGLKDFSISRLKEKMPWGISVPGDEDQVMYVWFDALTNYISTLGWPEDQDTFNKYWGEGTPTQYCGKDNTRFQSVMWQAMLIAADLPNSYQIVVNGHITAEGGTKMSKSLGNVVDPLEIADKYGTDALRLFLLKEISSFEDSPFTIERFLNAYNAHLANGLGNLTSRILTLSEKHCDPLADFSEPQIPVEVMEAMKGYDIQAAVQYIWSKISELDVRIANEKPFNVIKEDEVKGKQLIAELVRNLYMIARLLTPFLPETSNKIIELVKANKKPEAPLFARV